jgi:hypothetical protein
MKRCCRCREEKPLTEFNRDSGTRDGLQHRCHNCHRETSLAWKLSEAGRESNRRYARGERGREMNRLRRARNKQNNKLT